MNIKFFPMLDNKYIMVPYELVMKHQKQAFENHMQNVDRLAERGGLSMEELYYVLSDKPFGFKTGLTPSSIESRICDTINEYNKLVYLSEVSLVAQFNFLTISIYSNYYNHPNNDFNYGLNIGFLIPNTRLIER